MPRILPQLLPSYPISSRAAGMPVGVVRSLCPEYGRWLAADGYWLWATGGLAAGGPGAPCSPWSPPAAAPWQDVLQRFGYMSRGPAGLGNVNAESAERGKPRSPEGRGVWHVEAGSVNAEFGNVSAGLGNVLEEFACSD